MEHQESFICLDCVDAGSGLLEILQPFFDIIVKRDFLDLMQFIEAV